MRRLKRTLGQILVGLPFAGAFAIPYVAYWPDLVKPSIMDGSIILGLGIMMVVLKCGLELIWSADK